jgi:decaprenylphospho-beta-D-ribofuranose 2-oxidase
MFEQQEQLTGWGNFPRELCKVARPLTRSAQQAAVVNDQSVIARGLGRSYGDPSLSPEGLVLDQTSMHRMLRFDNETGILTCEAGVSFAEIIEVLLPRGWFLPTSPGTKFVTVGGAIAADVHGKNHHRVGSFGNFVRDIQLILAAGDVIICSPEENADIFWATVGGMGLTGIIQTATVQLTRVPSAYCKVNYQQTKDLDHTLEQFIDTDEGYEYSVAWVDCLAGGKSLGRSVLMLGNGAQPAELKPSRQERPFELPVQRKKTVPTWFPSSLMNRASIRAFNEVFYRAPRPAQAIVDFDKYFYPLDGLNHWNRMYGSQGFIQYQAWFPETTSRQGLVELLEKIVASGRGSFLAVLKSCGAASPGLLSFLDRGHTLALDFKNTGPDLLTLAQELDRIVLQHGGRLYLAKDATMSAETFAAMYPRLPEFRAIHSATDPDNKFISSQARRLQIVP